MSMLTITKLVTGRHCFLAPNLQQQLFIYNKPLMPDQVLPSCKIEVNLWNTSTNGEWRDIVRIMNTQKVVTTTLKNDCEQQIIICQCSEPTQDVQQIYEVLKYKTKPFTRKKSVDPLTELSKKVIIENQGVLSG